MFSCQLLQGRAVYPLIERKVIFCLGIVASHLSDEFEISLCGIFVQWSAHSVSFEVEISLDSFWNGEWKMCRYTGSAPFPFTTEQTSVRKAQCSEERSDTPPSPKATRFTPYEAGVQVHGAGEDSGKGDMVTVENGSHTENQKMAGVGFYIGGVRSRSEGFQKKMKLLCIRNVTLVREHIECLYDVDIWGHSSVFCSFLS